MGHFRAELVDGFKGAGTVHRAKGILDVCANEHVVGVQCGHGLESTKHGFCTCWDADSELEGVNPFLDTGLQDVLKSAGGKFHGGLKERDGAYASVGLGQWR